MEVAELGSELGRSCSSSPVLNGCTRLGSASYQRGIARQVAFLFRASVSLSGHLEGIAVCWHFIGDVPLFPQSIPQPSEIAITIIPSLRRRKLRHREVK